MNLDELKEAGEAAAWTTESAFLTLSDGYLLDNETPRDMYTRVSNSVAKYLKKPELAAKFFDYMWKNWLCLSTPVAANAGTTRALPISCFGSAINDNLSDIFLSYHETAMLAKNGGGTSKYWGDLRQRGSDVGKNGKSDGIIPWLKTEESTIQSVSQGGVRRGSSAQYLPIESNDIEEFIDIRRPSGDINRRCQASSFHHAVCISDDFMNKCKDGDAKSRQLWEKILTARIETGEPYIFFRDTVNRNKPEAMSGRLIKASNLCSEICLPSDADHTFVCCLSSLNLARYDEWKDTDLIQTAIWFLDGIMSEFIDRAKSILGLEKAVRFAEKSRALGLGVLGWHTLLQSKMIPFESFKAMQLNNEIFSLIDVESNKATRELAVEYGEPEWCKGFGVRNLTRLAVAPTYSNSIISGGMSQGIEPIAANSFSQKTSKGTFINKNKALKALLEAKGKDSPEVWDNITVNDGSVSKLSFLSDNEKAVFSTAKEINQFSIISQAAQRQKYIDQSQSLNLFFANPNTLAEVDRKKLGKYIHKVHMSAWELGVKTLYYCRSSSILTGDSVYREESDCKACEG